MRRLRQEGADDALDLVEAQADIFLASSPKEAPQRIILGHRDGMTAGDWRAKPSSGRRHHAMETPWRWAAQSVSLQSWYGPSLCQDPGHEGQPEQTREAQGEDRLPIGTVLGGTVRVGRWAAIRRATGLARRHCLDIRSNRSGQDLVQHDPLEAAFDARDPLARHVELVGQGLLGRVGALAPAPDPAAECAIAGFKMAFARTESRGDITPGPTLGRRPARQPPQPCADKLARLRRNGRASADSARAWARA